MDTTKSRTSAGKYFPREIMFCTIIGRVSKFRLRGIRAHALPFILVLLICRRFETTAAGSVLGRFVSSPHAAGPIFISLAHAAGSRGSFFFECHKESRTYELGLSYPDVICTIACLRPLTFVRLIVSLMIPELVERFLR
jgi:hypothetical protein